LFAKLARPKKKRQKSKPDEPKPEPTPPTKQNSDNTVDTSRSIGSPGFQAGRDIGDVDFDQHITVIRPEPKPIREPTNIVDENLIWIGRRLMHALFGTLVHSMTGYALGSLGLTGVAVGFGYYAYERNPFPPASQPNTLLILSSWIAVVLTIYLGPFLVKVSRDTKCPECKARFSFYEKERLLTNTRRLPGKTLKNGVLTTTCRECGHTEKSPYDDVEYDQPPE